MTKKVELPASSIELTKLEVAEADRVAPAHREIIRGLLSDFNTGRAGVVVRRGDAPDVNETQARHIS